MTTLWNILLLFAAEVRFGSPLICNDHSVERFASFRGRGEEKQMDWFGLLLLLSYAGV